MRIMGTHQPFRPMLAASLPLTTDKLPSMDYLEKLRYPKLASYKMDGIRATMVDGKLISRSGKPIQNHLLREFFECFAGELNLMDGELVVGRHDQDTFRRTSSQVMSHGGDGLEGLSWYVFDMLLDRPYQERVDALFAVTEHLSYGPAKCVKYAPQYWISTPTEVVTLHTTAISLGYEGLILRDPGAPYKHGRSTLREEGMVKIKLFSDSEAEVLGTEPLMHNLNAPKLNEVGYVKRLGGMAGKVASDRVGKLLVRDIHTGVEFAIGMGFTEADSYRPWPVGTVVKYKYIPHGVKDKPRSPVFVGIRSKEDL